MNQTTLFEEEKRRSLGHLLIKVGRLYHEQSVSRVKTSLGLKRLTTAHLDLFPHIDFSGTTVVEIARRKGVSKQAVSRLVLELIDMDLLITQPNPKDHRSRLITFKTKGDQSIFKGFQLLKDLDAGLQKLLGNDQYTQTRESLLKIQDALLTDSVD